MADSNIGALPLAPSVADDSLLVMEQQGAAMKLTGQMLKSYAKQGVEMEFQTYLDEAKQAADSAAGAVESVTGMTVEAHSSDTPTVTKSTRAGKVNLDFGLPRGPQGEPGPEGQTGPRGPQGAPGNGLTILGNYNTEDALRAAVTAPKAGDAYGVGQEAPYDIYVFDGVSEDWKNYGQLSGGGGVIPENVVTSEGGAVMEFSAIFGDGPHTITITDDEEPPLTAEDIEYGEKTVKDAIDGLFTSVSDGKALIASAVTDKGVPTEPDAAFAEMAGNILAIQGGTDTSDATATPGDILAPKTAYTKSGKVEGVIPSLPAQTITPGTADKTIANGQYLAGTQTIKGDPNLTSGNIKKGVSLFGVVGALETNFAATLTVTADIGAVVTATCGDTSVEALSTTGKVVLELPIEGTWKVTAVRGMAQYNTVTLEVSSQYSAELTAEVHIEYMTAGAPLIDARYYFAAASVGNYALFGGGSASSRYATVDAYSTSLAHSVPVELSEARDRLAAAAAGNYALFAGGYAKGPSSVSPSDVVDAYNASLTHSVPVALSEGRASLAAASIGNYALFAGGASASGSSDAVDAYNASLTHSTPTVLISPAYDLAAASNSNYALFGGGRSDPYTTVSAYNASLTRSLPTALGAGRYEHAAAAAGNYVLFGGGSVSPNTLDAYDLFLTRTTPEPLSAGRTALAATTVKGYALFGGGVLGSESAVMDVYDPYLTHTVSTPLSKARHSLAAASIGNYALFAGGVIGNSTASSIVDIYRHV